MNCSIKEGCYNVMPCNYSYLQDSFYKRFDGAICKTLLLEEFDNKVQSSSPSKTFFSAFAKMQDFLCDLHVCLMYYAHVKRLHSVKWRSLYGDTARMQELLLKTCTSSARRKNVWNETVTESCMGQDCSTHWR